MRRSPGRESREMSSHCEHDHSHDEALSPLTLADRLSAAPSLCEASGERMTSSRLRTLELILSAQGPVKAYEVIDRFHDDGAAKPPTVYRALGFLEQMGLIHRIESLNACHTQEASHRAAFLLCECCGKSEEVALHQSHEIETAARESGFVIAHVTLEARGRCKACQ
jgi:Fur family transcriptional regulator, zinc uptake regulator